MIKLITLLAISCISIAKMTITSDNATIDNTKQIITYEGNVELISNDINIKADKVMIETLDKDKKIYQTTAYGDDLVTFTRKNQETIINSHAKTIIYNNQNQILELRGNAMIQKDEQAFNSDNIIYDIKTNKINLTSNKDNKVKIKIGETTN